MKKKLYLRIQSLVLVLLMILTTFVIVPQQVRANTIIEPATESDIDLAELLPEQIPDQGNNSILDTIEVLSTESTPVCNGHLLDPNDKNLMISMMTQMIQCHLTA